MASGKSITWVVVQTYYKHAEYSLDIYRSSEELKELLQQELSSYRRNNNEILNKSQQMQLAFYTENGTTCLGAQPDIDDLIELCVDIGNEIVDAQNGWGVREIVEIYM